MWGHLWAWGRCLSILLSGRRTRIQLHLISCGLWLMTSVDPPPLPGCWWAFLSDGGGVKTSHSFPKGTSDERLAVYSLRHLKFCVKVPPVSRVSVPEPNVGCVYACLPLTGSRVVMMLIAARPITSGETHDGTRRTVGASLRSAFLLLSCVHNTFSCVSL